MMNCICIHCGKSFKSNPRVKNQIYCSQKECQKARRARWQRLKMARDPDYKENQARCYRQWRKKHLRYQGYYRRKHPEYVKRNRTLQILRDAKRRKDRVSKLLVKMDSLKKGFYSRDVGLFKLIPQENRLLVKMDSLIVKLIPYKRL